MLGILLPFGIPGLALLAIADSSFLFFPVGIDLLMVLLVARHHDQLVWCVLAASVGSVVGVFLLDLVCRKGGEEGLERLVKPKQLNYLKRKMEKRAEWAIVVSCIAPPPFPFTATIAVASALQYPRVRLLMWVLVARAVRFSLVGWAAIYFGRSILRIANSSGFLWFMGAFIAFCVVGSVMSIVHWIHVGRSK